MNKLFSVLIIAVALLFALSGCHEKKKQILHVLVEPESPPFCQVRGGEFVGIGVDIIRTAASKMGYDIEFETLHLEQMLEKIVSGEADIGAACLSVTKERLKRMDFCTTLMREPIVAVVRKDSGIRSIAEIAGHHIGIKQGSTTDDYLTNFSKVDHEHFIDISDAFEALKSRKIDVVVTEQNACRFWVNNEPDMMIVPGILMVDDIAFAITRARHDNLKKRLDEVLEQMIADGTVKNIIDRHMNSFFQEKTAKKREIVILTDSISAPGKNTESSGMVGIDDLLIREIANDKGWEPVFRNYTFKNLLPLIQHGTGDIAASNIAILPEREKMVDFTIPYYIAHQVAIVLTESPLQHLNEINSPSCRIGSMLGTTSARLAEQYGNKEPECFSTLTFGIETLFRKKIDCFVTNDINAAYVMKKFPGKMRLLPEPLAEEKFALAVSKDRQDNLLEELNAAIEQMKYDGRLRRISEECSNERR